MGTLLVLLVLGGGSSGARAHGFCLRIDLSEFYKPRLNEVLADTENIALATATGRHAAGRETFFEFSVKETLKGNHPANIAVSFPFPGFGGTLPSRHFTFKGRPIGQHFEHHALRLFWRWRHSNMGMNRPCTSIHSNISEGADYLIFFNSHPEIDEKYEIIFHHAGIENIADTSKDAWYKKIKERVKNRHSRGRHKKE